MERGEAMQVFREFWKTFIVELGRADLEYFFAGYSPDIQREGEGVTRCVVISEGDHADKTAVRAAAKGLVSAIRRGAVQKGPLVFHRMHDPDAGIYTSFLDQGTKIFVRAWCFHDTFRFDVSFRGEDDA